MSVVDDWTPADYAKEAGALLAGVAALAGELAELTPERRLELAVSGGLKQLNADQAWTVDLAIAHALTALALQATSLPAGLCGWK